MDCFRIVHDSYYIVLTPLGRASWFVALGLLIWSVYSLYRPDRVARRFGITSLEDPVRNLMKVLVARDCVLAVAGLMLVNTMRIEAFLFVQAVAAVSCLGDAIAVSRARGVLRALDLWLLAVALSILASMDAWAMGSLCDLIDTL